MKSHFVLYILDSLSPWTQGQGYNKFTQSCKSHTATYVRDVKGMGEQVWSVEAICLKVFKYFEKAAKVMIS